MQVKKNDVYREFNFIYVMVR